MPKEFSCSCIAFWSCRLSGTYFASSSRMIELIRVTLVKVNYYEYAWKSRTLRHNIYICRKKWKKKLDLLCHFPDILVINYGSYMLINGRIWFYFDSFFWWNYRLCNRDILSHVQQVICFAFHDSRLLLETCQEAKNLRKIVTLFYLDWSSYLSSQELLVILSIGKAKQTKPNQQGSVLWYNFFVLLSFNSPMFWCGACSNCFNS